MMDTKVSIKTKISTAPRAPGCYLFKNKYGHVIYVGKAKNLRSRVQSYFRESDDDKVLKIARQAEDVEFFLTETKTDALLHEYRLIKQYKPLLNSQLNENMPHPLIKLDLSGRYASLSIVYNREKGKSLRYFDCFYEEQDAKDCLTLLSKVWKVPSCGQVDFSETIRSCLNHHLGSCMAPCIANADENEYAGAIAEVIRLFEGKKVKQFQLLEREILVCSEKMDFEKAAELNQLLGDLYRLQRKARRMFNFPSDRSVLVFLRAYREIGCTLFLVINGVLKLQKRVDSVIRKADAVSIIEMASGQSEPYPSWLSDAIREIYADKLFVLLPKNYKAKQMEEAILKHSNTFCS